jgi:two-component system, cell cycle sensor histidine kinase and response regulator CckA
LREVPELLDHDRLMCEIGGGQMPSKQIMAFCLYGTAVILVGHLYLATSLGAWLATAATLLLLGGPGLALVRRRGRGPALPTNTGTVILDPLMRQFDQLTGNSNDILLLIARDGTIVKANDRATMAYGYTNQELEGQPLRLIRAPESYGDVARQMEQVESKGGWVFETVHRRKNGDVFPVETSSRVVEIGGEKYFQSIVRDITERKKTENRLTRLNDCFLGFGVDPTDNINALVALCGELLGATAALYNKLEGGFLCSLGKWNAPEDFNAVDKPEGHLCYDLIRSGRDDLMVVRDLPATSYFNSDPNVKTYGLKTYVGKAVRFGQDNIGSLCAVFQHDFVPSGDDERLVNILAAAIGVEENRRRKDEALRESEERYRRLVELTPDAIAVHSGGRFVFVNPAGLRLIGANDLKDLVGMPIMEIVHPDYRELVKARLVGSAGKGSGQPFAEEKFLRFDGTAVDVEVANVPITYGGKPATLVVARGLEERKLAQKELIQLRKAVESSGEIIFMTDVQGVITFVNPEFSKVYGFRPEEVVGKATPRILKSGVLDQTQYEAFWNALLQKQVFKGELTNRTKDGRLITVEGSASPIFGEKNTIVGYLAIQRDITQRKSVEVALRESEASYKGLFNSVADAIYIQDREGRFLDLNQGAVDLYGYPREFLIGKTPEDLSAPGMNDHQKIIDAVRKTFTGEPQQFEFWGKRKNGEIFPKDVRLNRSVYFGQEVVVALGQDITERKKAEEAVRRSEMRFRRVWESSMDGMRILDADGRIVMVNDSFCRLMGKPEEELIGQPFTVLYESESVEQDESDRNIYRHRFENRSFAHHQEVELSLPQGRRILVGLSNSLLEIPNEPPLLLSIFRDMTERRFAEEKMRESEEKFRSLSEQSPNMIYINKGGKVVYVNEKCVELLGYSKEEFYSPSFSFLDLIAEDYRPLVQENFTKHLSGGEIPTYEYLLLGKNGQRIVGLHTTRLINYEGSNAILGIVTDITEHRRAEDELRRLYRAVEQSPTSIVITDVAGTIEYVNPKFTEVSGYSLEEVKGKTPRVLKSGYTSPAEYTKLWETILSGKEWRGEFRNKKKNGELYWELASISPVRDASGTITHFLAVKEDVTARKMLEQQLWQAQKMESLGTLASGVAHDFNNILGIILGYASLLRQKSLLVDKAVPYVDSIITAAERGAGLVKQILTFARKSEFKLAHIDVNSIIGELTTMLGETFPKTITLSLQLEKDLPPLSIDRTQLHQALLNLCVNARDAMSEHGSISIATRLVNGGILAQRFPSSKGIDYVEISVSDTGSGIDEATKGRIFEPFFTTKDVGKGTGLGLSVVFGVVQEHQGFVDVESEPGRGSTFRVYLPLPAGSVIAPEIEGLVSQRKFGGTETVLVVEDEQLMLELVVTVLKDNGYHVLEAKDGEEALRIHAANEGKIDAVLSDYGLPRLDGWAACRRMKEKDPELIVFLASGYLEPDVKSEILTGGAAGFIGKPYSPSEILRRLRNALDK